METIWSAKKNISFSFFWDAEEWKLLNWITSHKVWAYLYPSMTTEVKIKLIRVCNVCVDRRSSWDIAPSSDLDSFGQNLNK